jgi:secreted PhoX family phosphatase
VDLTLTAPGCDANAAAKAAGATPFKRPENGQFRPGSKFAEFFFDETGDTDLQTEAGAPYGGFGAIFKLTQRGGPSAASGTIETFYLGDPAHTGLDNVSFWSQDEVVFVEDAGDLVHTQRQGFDSAYLFDVTQNYCGTDLQPTRILAQGRDASATLDSACSGTSGFQNDADNEITGWHTSDGDPTPKGILGAQIPRPFNQGWRTFYTQQHGDNVTYELTEGTVVQSSRERTKADADDQ